MIKLPKTVPVDGYDWKVIIEKDMMGGSFDTATKEIFVGGKYKNEIGRIFCHEVLEAILTTRGCRYQMYGSGTNDRLLFSFYHYELENIVNDLYYSLRGIIKEEI
jgi:hypothetical protein